jgi:hypothetical protein
VRNVPCVYIVIAAASSRIAGHAGLYFVKTIQHEPNNSALHPFAIFLSAGPFSSNPTRSPASVLAGVQSAATIWPKLDEAAVPVDSLRSPKALSRRIAPDTWLARDFHETTILVHLGAGRCARSLCRW